MNPAAESKSLHFREHSELRLNVKPVPVFAAGSIIFQLFPGLKYSILSHTLTPCVVDHAINPVTYQAMPAEEELHSIMVHSDRAMPAQSIHF